LQRASNDRRPYSNDVLDIPPATVTRAISLLRSGAMRADAFARAMWPERSADRTPGQQSRSGYALLLQLGRVGYVQQVGDLWTLRTVGTADLPLDSAVHAAVPTGVLTAVGLPVGQGVGLADGLPVGPALGEPDPQSELQRLHRLVRLADAPIPTVTHDQALGDIAIRAAPLDVMLVDGCGLVVLRGRSANVYPPCGAPRMLVGLQPAEGARALYLRWSQSGQPPNLPRPSAWITVEDGFVATPGAWRPAGAPMGWMDPEDVRVRVARQRAAAGLA
jgi:hypothetical protein